MGHGPAPANVCKLQDHHIVGERNGGRRGEGDATSLGGDQHHIVAPPLAGGVDDLRSIAVATGPATTTTTANNSRILGLQEPHVAGCGGRDYH